MPAIHTPSIREQNGTRPKMPISPEFRPEKIHADLGAKRSLGIHWGTFELTDEALDVPPQVLAQLRETRGVAAQAFFTLAVGGTEKLQPRQRPRTTED